MYYVKLVKELEPLDTNEDVTFAAEFNAMEEDDDVVIFVAEFIPTTESNDVEFAPNTENNDAELIDQHVHQQTPHIADDEDVVIVEEYIHPQTPHNDDDVVFIG